MAKLILVCGLPGSGKTTHATRLETEVGAIRFCPDEWMLALGLNLYDEQRRARIEAVQWELAQRLLACGSSVVIEWGTWGRSERDALRLRARELNAAVELHYLCPPFEILFERIRRRGAEDPPIEREMLEAWVKTFEVPTAEEMSLFDAAVTIES